MTEPARTLEILEKLIAFPSVCGQSNLDLINWTQAILQDAGFAITRINAGAESKAGLFATIGPAVAGGICLSAHTDVVPTEGQAWTRAPFTLSQDTRRLYGKGTTDMKGFLASALALAERVQTSALRSPLSLSISYDEEIGCVGIQKMLPRIEPLIGRPRAVIIGEPTAMQVATGHKGKATYRVRCHGQAGHSALAPDYVNAVHLAADFVQRVRSLQNALVSGPQDAAYSIPYSTVHIGRINGGRALNIVPDTAELDMELRHLAGVPVSQIASLLEDITADVSQSYPQVPGVTLDQTNAYPGLDTPSDDPVIDLALGLAQGSTTTKVPFGTEAGVFAQLGLSTVIIGPGDMARDGHKADEGLDKSQLVLCDAMMNRVAEALMHAT